MNFSVKNFTLPNTPNEIRTVGNYLLLAGIIGAAMVTYHVENPGNYFPPFLLSFSSILAIAGTIGKAITMFFGVSNAEEVAKLVAKTNKALNKSTDDSVAENPLKVISPETKTE